jgi:hypothetical protein
LFFTFTKNQFIYLGVPDPIKSCQYTYINATLTVNCVPGFHQGDEDFFCYMYKRQDNGSFSEHARLKGLAERKSKIHNKEILFSR